MSTMQYVDPRELNDLASLAAKGGLARGVAYVHDVCTSRADLEHRLTDCVAEAPDQLMYIAGDELILLRDLGDILLASCEGVVGWVRKGDVRFEAVASTSGKSSLDLSARDSLPRTILTAPSPPTKPTALPEEPDLSQATRDLKRVSGPFELDSPQQSPAIEREGQQFFVQQNPPEPEAEKRQSVTSVASSEAFGGIGGFMMGDETTEEGHDSFGDGVEDLTGAIVVNPLCARS